MPRPDIFLIILDTLRRDHLSIYGHHRETSPAFDAFAAEGTRFTRAVAPAQWTIPAHASLFTGLYPGTHQVTQGDSRLADAQPTLAEHLRAAGYHTAAFCNNPLVGVLNNGLQRGFNAFFNYASAIPYRPTDEQRTWLRREFTRRFRPYARRIGNQFALSDRLFRWALHPLFVPIWSRYINFKGLTAQSMDDLIDYYRAHKAGGARQPLFTFVNLMSAHLPYHPPGDWLDRIAPGVRRDKRAMSFMRRFNADGAGWASPPDSPYEDWQTQTLNDFYDAEIAHQDYHLGRLLTAIQAIAPDATVIIAADHGESHGEHNLFGHGFNVHQELVHVPLAVRSPEVVRGEIKANISTRRLYHTILDVAGVDRASEAERTEIERLSLAHVGAADEADDAALSEAFVPMIFLGVLERRSPSVIARLKLAETRRGLYDGDYKLIVRGEQIEGLYRISDDPDETRNLAAAEPERAAAMGRALIAHAHHAEAARSSDAATTEHDAEVLDHLRALGYID